MEFNHSGQDLICLLQALFIKVDSACNFFCMLQVKRHVGFMYRASPLRQGQNIPTPVIPHALACAGFSSDEIEMIAYRNPVRTIRDILN